MFTRRLMGLNINEGDKYTLKIYKQITFEYVGADPEGGLYDSEISQGEEHLLHVFATKTIWEDKGYPAEGNVRYIAIIFKNGQAYATCDTYYGYDDEYPYPNYFYFGGREIKDFEWGTSVYWGGRYVEWVESFVLIGLVEDRGIIDINEYNITDSQA